MSDAPAPTPRWASINTTCAYLGVSRDTLYRMMSRGLVKKRQLGKLIRIDLNQVDRDLNPELAAAA